MTRALVVDDERKMRRVLQILLEQMGIESTTAESGEDALSRIAREKVDVVLTDLKMPGMSGVDLLSEIRELDADVPVIVMTAHGTVETAVEAMKRGAFDYIRKPFDLEVIEGIIRNALEVHRYRTENRFLREQVSAVASFENLVGSSPPMQALFDLLRQVAATRSTVLITGETGTGKELVAHAIHNLSPRRNRLFVALNCAAIPSELMESELFGHIRGAFTGASAERPGKFELADGGTLFLDEIGDMPYPLQAKLLRVLEEGVIERIGSNSPTRVDVRIASSTNRDLETAIAEGRFRQDLLYRLNVFHLHVPPLRERREDIPMLAEHFLKRFGEELGRGQITLSGEALQGLTNYAWPGNVRELRNVMERAAVLCQSGTLDLALLRLLLPGSEPVASRAASASEGLQLDAAVEEMERKIILRALGVAGDNKSEAARLLGVSERTLWYKLKRYGL